MPRSPLTFLVEPPPVWYIGDSDQSTLAISRSPVLTSTPSEHSDQSDTPQLLLPKATSVTVPEDHPEGDTLVSDDESESDTYIDEGADMTADFNRLTELLLNHKRHSEHWEEQQVEIKESEIEVIGLENKEQEVWVGVLENEWAKDLIQDIEQREEDLQRRERELGILRKTVDRREEAVSKREREFQFRAQEIVSQENRHRETRLREEIVRRELEAQRKMIERREVAVAEQEKGLQVREQEIISLEERKIQGTKQREERVQIQEEKLIAFKGELMDREREMMKQIDLKEELLGRREKAVEQCFIWITELDEKDDSSQKQTAPARHEEEKRMLREKHKDQQKEDTVQRDEGIPVRKYEGLDEEEKKINLQRVQLREHEEKLESQSRDIDRRFSMLQRKETAFAKELAFAKNCLRSARQLKTNGHHSSRFRLPRDSEEDEHTSDSEVMVTQRARAVRAQRLTASGIRPSGRFLDGANGFSINANRITMIAG